MVDKKPEYITHLTIPGLRAEWSKDSPGEINIKFERGGNANVSAAKGILNGFKEDLQDSINSDIRGSGTPNRISNWSETSGKSKDLKTGASATAKGEVEGSAEGSVGVDSTYAKGGGRVLVGGETSVNHERASGESNSKTYTVEAGKPKLDGTILQDAQVRARLGVIDALTEWDKKNPTAREFPFEGQTYKIGPNAIKDAVKEEQLKLVQEFGAPMKKFFDDVKGGYENLREKYDGLKDKLNPMNLFSQDTSGFESPSNPYAKMFAANLDTIRGDTQLQAKLGPGATPEQLATAVTFAASQQNVSPDTRFAFQANERGMLFGQAQGNVADPAAARVNVDAGNLNLPSPEQVAQLDVAPQQQQAPQSKMTVA